MSDDYETRVEQLEEELLAIKRGDHKIGLGIFQGIGSALLVLTVGELIVWYVNWFCVWLMYWLVVHILPFRIIYDLRLVVWGLILFWAGFWTLPSMVYGYLNSNGKSYKTTARNIAYFIVLIPGLIIWLIDVIKVFIHVHW